MTRSHLTFALCLLPFAFLTAQQPRDGAGAVATGTSTLAGRVVSFDAAQTPIRRAIVQITGVEIKDGRSAITDDDGRFSIGRLPAGRYSVSASKAAYLTSEYGAPRPARPGTQVSIANGQRADITIRMARGAVLAGEVRDARGRPVAGMEVRALTAAQLNGPPGRLAQAELTSTTDDRGMYRIFGLAPGEYLVATMPKVNGSGDIGRRSEAEMDALLATVRQQQASYAARPGARPAAPPGPPRVAPAVGFGSTFYPGTQMPLSAARLRLAAGDVKDGIDFTIGASSVATIEGTVTSPEGAIAGVTMSVQIAGLRIPLGGGNSPILARAPGADGTFKYTNLTPGHYTITARGSRAARAAAPATPVVGGRGGAGPPAGESASTDWLYAVAELDVDGGDLTGVTLVLVPGSIFSGRVVFDGAKPPADLSAVRLNVQVPGGTYFSQQNNTVIGNTFSAVLPIDVKADGSFEGRGIAPGIYLLRSTLPPALGAEWWLRSAVVDGKDLLDAPLEVKPGVNLAGAILTFTDRHSELAGSLQTAAGQPAPGYFVVVFPADRAAWRAGSRRIQIARPGTDGMFSVKDLPAGAYRLAALTDVDSSDLSDSAFLAQLEAQSVPVTVTDGARTVQDLKIGAAPTPGR